MMLTFSSKATQCEQQHRQSLVNALISRSPQTHFCLVAFLPSLFYEVNVMKGSKVLFTHSPSRTGR